MSVILRNFFYATGLVLLLGLYSLNAETAKFADLVRLIQNYRAQEMVAVLTLCFVAADFILAPARSRSATIAHHTVEASEAPK